MVRITRGDFLRDSQGRRYADVVNSVPFDRWLAFFNDPQRQQRLVDSERDHDRPPLAAVVRELEHTPVFKNYLSQRDKHRTRRGRQAIGVIVKLVMLARGWHTTGSKGAIRRRLPTRAANRRGLSQWFTKAERYEPKGTRPY